MSDDKPKPTPQQPERPDVEMVFDALFGSGAPTSKDKP